MKPGSTNVTFVLALVGTLSVALVVPPGAPALDDECRGYFEGKTVRWVVPHKTGGGYDAYSRLFAPYFAKTLGTEVRIENVSGAGGVIGATNIKEARADGLTVGILNAPGLMMAALAGEEKVPNPAEDFTILARMARSQQIWGAASRSEWKTIDDVLANPDGKKLVFATRDVGSLSFVNIAVASRLLGIETDIVAGYDGTPEGVLAAVRGDVDFVAYTFESILKQIEAGDVRPLMQVASARISDHKALDGVPLLAGEDGVAARRAKELGKDVEQFAQDATALAALLGAGRVIGAPLGLEEKVKVCLEAALHESLTGPEFTAAAAAAERSLDVAKGAEAQADVRAAAARGGKFIPIVEEAIEKLRR